MERLLRAKQGEPAGFLREAGVEVIDPLGSLRIKDSPRYGPRSDLATIGAAVVGGVAAGLFRYAGALERRFVRPLRTVQPRPKADAAYRRNIEVYRKLFERLQPKFRHPAGGEC